MVCFDVSTFRKDMMNHSRMRRAIEMLISLLLVAGCSNTDNKQGESAEQIPVEVMTVTRGSVKKSFAYDGDIEAEYEIGVFSRVPDRIEKFFVDVGDYVQKGAPIARVRATTIEQAVRQAEAGLVAAKAQEANARLEYERSGRLHEEKALSQQQLDAVKTQFEAVTSQREQAEAMLETAKSQLTDAQISAPISGIIAGRNYDAGDMASPGQPVVTIVQMRRVKVKFDIAETDLGKVKLADAATVRVKSYTNRTFAGKVSRVSPVLDRLTRMAEVEVLIDNKDMALKPGMFARVEVTTGLMKNVIVVPRHAIIESTSMQEGGKGGVTKVYFAYVVRENKAEQRKLDVVYANHEFLAVGSGLSEGDLVVTLGQNSLRDGAPVIMTNGGEGK